MAKHSVAACPYKACSHVHGIRADKQETPEGMRGLGCTSLLGRAKEASSEPPFDRNAPDSRWHNRTFLGLFPSLLLMKSTELKVSPISVFSKMGNRKSNLEATKGESFYHGAE